MSEAAPRMKWSDIDGWSNDIVRLYRAMVDRAVGGERFVELGTWVGRSTAFMANAIKTSGKDIRFYAIDHGRGSPELSAKGHRFHTRYNSNVASVAVSNLGLCDLLDKVTYIVGDSLASADLFPDGSLDFVMLDANHTYEHVAAEIARWLPKVKTGGIIAGHDCSPVSPWFPGVLQAVREAFGFADPRLNPQEDWNLCWGFQKTPQEFVRPDLVMRPVEGG